MEFECKCGTTRFQADEKPLFRILCHCTICQRYSGGPFGDVLVFRADAVSLPSPEVVTFDAYKAPPNVKRGKCTSCEQAAVETFITPFFPKLVMVPTPMLATSAEAPEPKAHMFYDKRIADQDDGLPKHHGFLRSQFAFMKCLREATR